MVYISVSYSWTNTDYNFWIELDRLFLDPESWRAYMKLKYVWGNYRWRDLLRLTFAALVALVASNCPSVSIHRIWNSICQNVSGLLSRPSRFQLRVQNTCGNEHYRGNFLHWIYSRFILKYHYSIIYRLGVSFPYSTRYVTNYKTFTGYVGHWWITIG